MSLEQKVLDQENRTGRFASLLSPKWVKYVLMCGLTLVSALLLIQIVLSLFNFQRTETFHGPFAVEDPSSQALVVSLNRNSRFDFLVSSAGDSPQQRYASAAVVTANGKILGPGHVHHDLFRAGNTPAGYYSHWGSIVLFSLPEGVPNSEATTITVQYALLVREEWITIGFIFAGLFTLLLGMRMRANNPKKLGEIGVRGGALVYGTTLAISAVVMLASLVFLVVTLIGWLDGWSLPTTAIFSYAPWVRGLAKLEPAFAHMVLIIASVGAIFAWIALTDPAATNRLKKHEDKLVALFSRYGLFVVLAWFLFSAAGTWAGIPRPEDLSGNAIAGLVPFNDAMGHFAQTFDQAVNGNWNYFASRRPLAAALRSVGMFLTGYSNTVFFYLQITLLALTTFIATRSIMRWRGPWVGLTFLGLSTILVRPYLPTNLTEPLGLLIAMASVPFIVGALSTGSLAAKGTGFLMTNLALGVRMGNMFSIPAIAFWMLLTSGKGWLPKFRMLIVILAGTALAMGLTSTLSNSFGSKSGGVGANFSQTFCGLTHNADWTACGRIYADDLTRVENTEVARSRLFYQRGFEKLITEPWLLATRAITNALGFVVFLPRILLLGYTGTMPLFFPFVPWLGIVVFGLVRLNKRDGMPKQESLFWVLFFLSMLAAAAVVLTDDGIRVLCASYPVMFLFFASAFATRTSSVMEVEAQPVATKKTPYVAAGAIAAFIVISTLWIPSLAYKWDIVGGRALKPDVEKAEGDVYLASRYMTGFVVIPDGAPRRKDVPTIPYSDYRQIIQISNIEQYENIETPPPPFTMVVAPGLIGNGGAILIFEDDVLTNKSALGWRVQYSEGRYFKQLKGADPISVVSGDIR